MHKKLGRMWNGFPKAAGTTSPTPSGRCTKRLEIWLSKHGKREKLSLLVSQCPETSRPHPSSPTSVLRDKLAVFKILIRRRRHVINMIKEDLFKAIPRSRNSPSQEWKATCFLRPFPWTLVLSIGTSGIIFCRTLNLALSTTVDRDFAAQLHGLVGYYVSVFISSGSSAS